jgi:hypothetical protein
VKQYGLCTRPGVAFCPNCGRRLPHPNTTGADRVPAASTATPAPVFATRSDVRQ